jgi:hypothetical protein
MTFHSISANLPQLPADKANHVVYGIVLFMLLALIRSPEIALAIVAIVGVAKELYDKYTGMGTADVWDAAATLCGGTAGYLCTLID